MKNANPLTVQIHDFNIDEKQIEIFARRLLPEIKRYLSDENIRQELEKWKEEQGSNK